MIRIRRKLVSEKLNRVKLVRFNESDIIYNKENKRIVRAEFDSYAIGYVIGSENKLFVDAMDGDKKMYSYYESISDAMDGLNKRYIDEDEAFAIHKEELESTCNIKTNNLNKIKAKLMESKLNYNFNKK